MWVKSSNIVINTLLVHFFDVFILQILFLGVLKRIFGLILICPTLFFIGYQAIIMPSIDAPAYNGWFPVALVYQYGHKYDAFFHICNQ